MVFKGTLRVVKNVTKGYSDAEAKVREVTNSENIIPSGTQMSELAEMTYDQYVFPLYSTPVPNAANTTLQSGFCRHCQHARQTPE